MPIGEPGTGTYAPGQDAQVPTGGLPPATQSPAFSDIMSTILSQLGPSIAGSQLGSAAAGNQLDLNAAMYGPNGLLSSQLNTQYGYDTQKLGLSNAAVNEQLQLNPQLQSIEQQQYGIQGQQYGLQGQSLQQQLAENANQYQQQLLGQYGSAAASGATNSSGAQNAISQINKYSGPGGFNEQGINRSIANLGLTEQSSALGNQAQQLQYIQSQNNLQRTLQSNNLSGQELLTGLNQGIQQLGMQGASSADQILEQLAQGYENLAPNVASSISQVGIAGGIPNIFPY